MGISVLGNIDARKSTAPNSKRREFHADREWDT
jgi:hypothetical protein